MWDNSQISQFQFCPFSYYLQYVVGLKLKQEDTKRQGSEIHELLEQMYGSGAIMTEDKQYSFLMDSYCDKYKDDNFEVLAVEKPIHFSMFDKDFVVKVDTVVKSNGNVFGLEHKTTSTRTLDDKYFAKFRMSGQMPAQQYAIEKEFGVCNGIIVNGIALKSLKRKPTSKAYYKWKRWTEGSVP